MILRLKQWVCGVVFGHRMSAPEQVVKTIDRIMKATVVVKYGRCQRCGVRMYEKEIILDPEHKTC